MITLYKYSLNMSETSIKMPRAAIVRYVGTDSDGMMSLWAEVDTDNDLVTRLFHILGTGHPFPPYWLYVGSFMHLNVFMWHVYEEVL